ncbi:MAG: hypothetical protein QF442_01080 [Candidatus Peribacteraceae bacterium]|nr:hypothetical protein [Candidatus Peribacteraceae bacterium]
MSDTLVLSGDFKFHVVKVGTEEVLGGLRITPGKELRFSCSSMVIKSGIGTKQLLGDELFQSMINEINQKNWPLPDSKKEFVTGIQQTVRDFVGGKWGYS